MAELRSNIPYTPYPTVSAQGGGGTPMGVRANPNDAGAQVSEAVQGAGKEGFDLALKQQGMINETAMTNADADFATKVGKIKGDYTTLTGQAAFNSFPKYQEDIKAAFQESRAGLPPAAQRGFDMMATRTMANHIADGSSYASSQLKEAQRDSYTNLANSQFSALLDPSIAADKERSQYHIDSLKYAAQAQVPDDHPGLQSDSATGTVSYADTPEGHGLKAQTQQREDEYVSKGYVNRFSTLAKTNVSSAYDEYQKERESLPRGAQVSLDAMFAPKIFDMHKDNASSSALQDADHGHWQALTNPHASDISDAIHMQESGGKPHDYQIQPSTFEQYARPGEKFDNPSDQDAVYGRIIDDLKKSYPNDSARQAVAYFSGKGNVAPEGSPTVWKNDTEDKLGKSVSSYVNDISSRLGSAPVGSTYGKNENGAPLSKADYYMTHKQDILANGDAYAENLMPGDLAMKRAVRQSLDNYMNSTIQNQHAQYMMDNRNVMRAINGELTKGNPPATEQDLRAVPGVSALLDKVAYQDPKFSETIPTLVAKASRQNVTTNSANGYDTILRTLEPHGEDHPNAIASQDHLDRALGRSDGTGINMKDYNDAKPLLETDQTFKETLSKHMQDIAAANGNLDGKGQDRAMAWLHQVMDAKKQNDKAGENKLSDADFIMKIGEKDGPPTPVPPSRMQQIENWASSLFKGKDSGPLKVTSLQDYNTVPKGVQYIDPDGKTRTKQ